jgi:hypothetical protein
MSKSTLRPLLRIALAALVVVPLPAFATAQRTFVASTGNDANPCTLSQPCRGFAAAVAQTSTQGEVVVLDSAGYGPVAISQSVTILAPAGIYAGVSVFSGDGVSIDSPPSGGVLVRIVGLTIVGQNPAAANGISVMGNSYVTIERCSATNMMIGLYVIPGTSGPVTVETSEFSGNRFGMDVAGGINIVNTVANGNLNEGLIHRSGYLFVRGSAFDYNVRGASLSDAVVGSLSAAVIEDSEFRENSFEGIAGGNYTITIKGGQFTANGSIGVLVGPRASLIGSLIMLNQGAGINVGTGTVVTLDGVTISENHNNGVNIAGSGVVQTLQSNTIMNNTPSDIAGGALTPIGHQ